MEENKNILGGFEAILDSFIPNDEGGVKTPEVDAVDDDELEDIKNSEDPIAKKAKQAATATEEEDEEIEDDVPAEDDEEVDTTPKGKTANKSVDTTTQETNTDDEAEVVTSFFDVLAEKFDWDFEEDEKKPKTFDELVEFMQATVEESSKPEYASEEVEQLDNFVKQGGNLREYLTIDAELDLDDIDIEDETNQKLVVKELLKEKGFSAKQIEKKLTKYEDAGLLEDEAEDAIEDLKEIRQQKKEQLLTEQKRQYDEYMQRQQQFYESVVGEIKNLKNIRGINVPEKDKRVLIDYILKPDAEGKTKYQRDYAKGGVKNLIESAYFTMNADKLLDAAKREGNNNAIERFKRSLKTGAVNSKSKQQTQSSNDDPIWLSAARKLRIS
nr:MAG TPA: hypothetical protein [Caudoviricetes sp.]